MGNFNFADYSDTPDQPPKQKGKGDGHPSTDESIQDKTKKHVKRGDSHPSNGDSHLTEIADLRTQIALLADQIAIKHKPLTHQEILTRILEYCRASPLPQYQYLLKILTTGGHNNSFQRRKVLDCLDVVIDCFSLFLK